MEGIAKNVAEFLFSSATRSPHGVCVSTARETFTYEAVCRQVLALEKELQEAHLPSGVAVGLVAENGVEFLVGLFALLSIEVVVVPLPVQLTEEELGKAIDEFRLCALLVQSTLSGRFGGFALQDNPHFSLRHFERRVSCCPHVPEAAVIRPTSGTTSRSKGVILSHSTIYERTEAAQAALSLSPGKDIVCSVLPMAQHFVVTLLTYVRYGIEIAVPDSALAEDILELISQRRCSILYAAPLHFSLLAADLSGRTIDTIRLAISTSSSLSIGVSERFSQRFGISPRQAYGIIELGLPLGDLLKLSYGQQSVGSELPGFSARLRALDGQWTQSYGELYLHGPGMFDGYLSPPSLREEVTEDGWFATGDIAERLDDGSIVVRGRKKSVIITAGNKVFPEEVEDVLERYPAIRASRVYGEEHSLLGELVVAEVELQEAIEVDEFALRKHCRAYLAPHMVPQRIDVVSAIRRTKTGKALRITTEMG